MEIVLGTKSLFGSDFNPVAELTVGINFDVAGSGVSRKVFEASTESLEEDSQALTK